MDLDSASIADRIAALLDGPFYSDTGVLKTPLEYSAALSELSGCSVYLKCENLQTSGSFKIRGATSAVLNLSEADKVKGVITASSGNHGAATAIAASALGIPVTIYVPESISAMKEEKISHSGATLIKVPGTGEIAEREAARVAREQGLTYISPYNHADIIAGQGTIGEEILADLPEVDAIFASVGGGGLISGIGCRVSRSNPAVEIVGCWPEHAPAMLECMKAGKVIDVPEQSTLSDGTAGGVEEGALTLPLCKALISSSVTVSESEIAQAMKLVHDHHGYIIEGAAGVALAGLLKDSERYQGKNVVIVLCGENISEDRFEAAMEMTAPA
jgi:threonine dehydratase